MAWTNPVTYIAGAILTAAQMNVMQANALAGGPIYATEAARDAAITSPFEGQRAYITGSTVASASAATYAGTPTGIQTIYNGAAWVCVTEVGSYQSNVGTTSSSAYTATLGGSPGTNPAVTISTGTSAMVMMSVHSAMSGTASAPYTSFAVSGATTLAASDSRWMTNDSDTAGYWVTMGKMLVITGLTAGTNTFTLNYRVSTAAQTGSFQQRSIVVKGIA